MRGSRGWRTLRDEFLFEILRGEHSRLRMKAKGLVQLYTSHFISKNSGLAGGPKPGARHLVFARSTDTAATSESWIMDLSKCPCCRRVGAKPWPIGQIWTEDGQFACCRDVQPGLDGPSKIHLSCQIGATASATLCHTSAPNLNPGSVPPVRGRMSHSSPSPYQRPCSKHRQIGY